jgi:hypothetical protein
VTIKQIDEASQDQTFQALYDDLQELHDSPVVLYKPPKASTTPATIQVGDDSKKVPVTDDNKWFKAIRREVRNEKTGKLINIETELEIKDQVVQNTLPCISSIF